MAQRAAAALRGSKRGDAYDSYAKSFPALIHTAGLCQAIAFLQAKCPDVLSDVIATIGDASGAESFATRCREAEVPAYMHLTRITLDASIWIKRYVEAGETEIVSSAPEMTGEAAEPPR
jgi:CRISPR-associated protein Cmr5